MRRLFIPILLLLAAILPAQSAPPCSACAAWNRPQAPLHIYGDTYYVGVHGLASILIVSDQGDILIDGDLDISPAQIAAHVKSLGFKLSDIKLILNTHAHSDHAGGIAELQRMTGAPLAASPWSAALFKKGGVARDDPQYGSANPIAAVAHVRTIHDGETVRVGPLALTAHFTPGHTSGGTSWTWTSCQDRACRHIAYVDSLTAVSATGYRFTAHPEVVAQFRKSFAVVGSLPCDILLTPHPEASDFYARVAKGALEDPSACRALADRSRAALEKRLASER